MSVTDEWYFDLTETLRKQKAIDTVKAWNKLSRRIACLSFEDHLYSSDDTAGPVLVVPIRYSAHAGYNTN